MTTQYFGHIEPFDPDVDNWTVYLECVEQFFVANSVADEKKASVPLTSLGKKGYSLLRNLVAPAKPADKGYDDLVRVMKEHFTPKPAVIAERYRFHQRKQHEGETVAQYLAELRKLTEACEFKDSLEEALCDRLVCGMHNEAIQR